MSVAPSLSHVADDIRTMRIRGAAPLAVAAAHALAAHARAAAGQPGPDARVADAVRAGARLLLATRPTAVSLRHALAAVVGPVLAAPSAQEAARAATTADTEFAAAVAQSTQRIAAHGARLLAQHAGAHGVRVLTHCHSSTVVALLAAAHRAGVGVAATCDETRPFGQGLVTVAALAEAGVPATLIVDSAAWSLLASGAIDCVVVGADTVANDGSLFNKIGTAAVAQLAGLAGVPVYCAAGFLKFSPDGPDAVVVEERESAEVVASDRIPPGVEVLNPVFDRTPPASIRGYITEDGVREASAAVAAALERIPKEVSW